MFIYASGCRFLRLLHSRLEQKELESNLADLGLDAKQLGSHSIRKSSVTYTSSVAGVTPFAIDFRAGWKVSGIKQHYVHYNAQSDQRLGRAVAGLPQDSNDFSLLPPHFSPTDEGLVRQAVTVCFPAFAKASTYPLLERCLASLVHHQAFLRQTLSPTHPLFLSPLFAHPTLLSDLSECVIVGTRSDWLRATGIPVVTTVLNRITDEIKTLATPRKMGASSLKEEETSPRAMTTQTDTNVLFEPFLWGDAHRLLPEDFTFPSGGVVTVWLLYWCGNYEKKYPPLSRVAPHDFASKNLRKRFSDLKFLATHIANILKQRDQWIENPTVEQALEMFELAKGSLSVFSASHQTGRHRRLEQMKWLSVVKQLRAQKE